MTFDLTISAPRSVRWYELADLCSHRRSSTQDLGDGVVWRLAETPRVARRLLGILLALDHAATVMELSGRSGLGRTRTLSMLRYLRAEGDAQARTGRSQAGHTTMLWSAR